jgi:DNA helicase TIP49 (TBP-interacting protein)
LAVSRIQAMADFPTGFLFVNEGDLMLDIEFFAFQGSVRDQT